MTDQPDTGMEHVLLEDVFFFAPPDPFKSPAPPRILAPAQIPLAEASEEPPGFLAEDAFSVETAEAKPVDSSDIYGPTIAAIVRSTAR